MKTLVSLAVAILAASSARAEFPNVKVGVLTDLKGPYAAFSGPGSIEAARMAVEDCMKADCKGMKIDFVSADHENKVDIGKKIVAQWYDHDGVDAIFGVQNSSIAMEMQKMIRDRGKFAFYEAAATRLTNEECVPGGIAWLQDTYALASGTAKALTKSGKSWYYLTVDYVFGESMEKRSTTVVQQNEGKVLGSVKHPLGAKDFDPFLLGAQKSGADFIGLANAGDDMRAAVRAARKMGVAMPGSKQTLVPLLAFISDIHALGLELAQGMTVTTPFYWDLDETTRAWAKRFEERTHNMPTSAQASDYSATLHYLRSVAAAKTTQFKPVWEKMMSIPISDGLFKHPRLRSNGRMVHDMYVFQVKSPSESKYPWDYYRRVSTLPGEEVFQPLSESACPTK